MKQSLSKIKLEMHRFFNIVKMNINSTIIILTILTAIISSKSIEILLVGVLFYSVYNIKNIAISFFYNKKIKELSFDEFNNIDTLLDQFIANQLNITLLYHNLLERTISPNSELEQKTRSFLIDRVSKSISKEILDKLDLYYGEGNSLDLIAEKCYVQLSLYIAKQANDIHDSYE